MAGAVTSNLDYDSCKILAQSTYTTKNHKNQNCLQIIKEKYKDVINSPRDYERITDLEMLMKVLEKRFALNPGDIHVLEYIYGVLNINTKILENYKKEHIIETKSTQTIRGEDVENQQHANNASFKYPRRSNVPASAPFQDVNRQRLSERVINEISTRIGGSWRELARYLKLQECKIHGISQDKSLMSYEAKTRAMLQEYEHQAIPEELKVKLLRALRLAGRMDIHDKVEKLFLRDT